MILSAIPMIVELSVNSAYSGHDAAAAMPSVALAPAGAVFSFLGVATSFSSVE